MEKIWLWLLFSEIDFFQSPESNLRAAFRNVHPLHSGRRERGRESLAPVRCPFWCRPHRAKKTPARLGSFIVPLPKSQ